MKRQEISHEFVELMPSTLKEGTLYVSIPYETAVHLCACGCGIKVVTPISPPEWQLTWDGDTVSLHPSIGNWQFPCRSHYWIRRNRIVWSSDMTDEAIASGRARDARQREAYYTREPAPQQEASLDESRRGPSPARPSLARRLRQLFRLT